MVNKLSVCRICLSDNIGSGTVINNDLQEFYQKLTMLAFKTEDRRPMVMCYICVALLRKAYTFKLDCLAAEQLFSLLLDQANKETEIIIHRDKPKAKLSTKELEQVVIASSDCNNICVHPDEIDSIHIKQETSPQNDPLLDGDDTSDCIIPTEFELDTLKVEIKPEDGNSIGNSLNDVKANLSSVKNENKALLLGTHNFFEENTGLPLKIGRIKKRKATAIKAIKIDAEDLIAITSSQNEIIQHKEYNKNISNNVENGGSRPNMFDCHLCSKSFKYRSALSRHILTHTGVKPFNCANCHKSFAEKSNMIKHIRVQHPEVYSFTCHRCQKSFEDNHTLKTHLQTHSGDEAYKCDICQKGFKRKSELKAHSITHGRKPYQCSMCQKYYKNRNFLETHIRIAHTDEKRYKCDKCHLSFKQSYQLKIHLREHMGIKPYKCNICPKSFSYKGVLDNHIRMHTGEKPFKCDQCWKEFRQHGQLSTHIRTHTGERPYKCQTCSKCFIQPSDLKKHARIHTGERPYKCNICSTAFIQHYPWVLHMRSHNGEKPNECEVCQKKFRSRARLKKHSVVHTGEKPFSCNICHRDFGVKSTMRRHQRNVHNIVSKQSNVKPVE